MDSRDNLAVINNFWTKTKHIFVNSSWIIVGKILIFALGFAFVTGLANLTPPEVVGAFNYVVAVLTIASIATLPGMENALVRAVARGFEGSLKSTMRLRVLFGIFGSLVCIAMGIIYFAKGVPMLGYTFLIAAPFVPMTNTYNDMAYCFFQGRKEFKKSIFLMVLCQVMFSIPTLVVLFFTHNLMIIIASFLVFQTIGGLLIYSMAKPKNNARDFESERFGYHLTIFAALPIIAGNIDTIIVWLAAGPVAAAVYTFAFTPMTKLEQLIPIDTLTLPDLSNQKITSSAKKKLFSRTFLLVLLMIPLIIAGWVTAPFVFHLLFPKFPASVALFRALLVTLLTTPFLLLKTAFVAWHKKRELYINNVATPAIRIVAMMILGFHFGIWGVVAGVIISRFAEIIIVGILFAKTA